MHFSQLSQVTSKSPEHSRQKFWEIYLSAFYDWKFYLRGSREVSRKNFWVPSRLDLPLANKSLDWVARNIKNPNFEKYSKYFLRLWHWLASELRKSLCGIATGTCDWINPRLSRQNRATLFVKFLTFLQKQKTFQKQLKHSKIFLCLINKDWACENTFNQVQSHKWIWHSLNIGMCDACGYQQWDSS